MHGDGVRRLRRARRQRSDNKREAAQRGTRRQHRQDFALGLACESSIHRSRMYHDVTWRHLEKGPVDGGTVASVRSAGAKAETRRFDRATAFDLTPQLRYWGRATVLP
jgi:hypothetical protein